MATVPITMRGLEHPPGVRGPCSAPLFDAGHEVRVAPRSGWPPRPRPRPRCGAAWP